MAHRGVHDVLVAEVARDTADLVRRLDDYKRGHETPLTRSKQRLAPRVKALCLGPNMYSAQYVQGPACLGPSAGGPVPGSASRAHRRNQSMTRFKLVAFTRTVPGDVNYYARRLPLTPLGSGAGSMNPSAAISTTARRNWPATCELSDPRSWASAPAIAPALSSPSHASTNPASSVDSLRVRHSPRSFRTAIDVGCSAPGVRIVSNTTSSAIRQ